MGRSERLPSACSAGRLPCPRLSRLLPPNSAMRLIAVLFQSPDVDALTYRVPSPCRCLSSGAEGPGPSATARSTGIVVASSPPGAARRRHPSQAVFRLKRLFRQRPFRRGGSYGQDAKRRNLSPSPSRQFPRTSNPDPRRGTWTPTGTRNPDPATRTGPGPRTWNRNATRTRSHRKGIIEVLDQTPFLLRTLSSWRHGRRRLRVAGEAIAVAMPRAPGSKGALRPDHRGWRSTAPHRARCKTTRHSRR